MTDGAGDLWMFGGSGSGSNPADSPTPAPTPGRHGGGGPGGCDLNDVWRLDTRKTVASGKASWVWEGGTKGLCGDWGNHVAKRVPEVGQVPSCRHAGFTFHDPSEGAMWILGGERDGETATEPGG